MSEIINTIYVLRQEYNQTPPEIDCCLNDLPNNDFNTTFKFIPSFNKKLIREGYFMTFLRMRSDEMVSSGRMVLKLLGRNTINDPFVQGLLSLFDIVSSFKMPFYDPTEEEVKKVIRNEGSFMINDLETHAFDFGHSNKESSSQSYKANFVQKKNHIKLTQRNKRLIL
ncbi:hypothetical protein YC2023_120848 [Brassica napus]